MKIGMKIRGADPNLMPSHQFHEPIAAPETTHAVEMLDRTAVEQF
jgi:hypothetical protein